MDNYDLADILIVETHMLIRIPIQTNVPDVGMDMYVEVILN